MSMTYYVWDMLLIHFAVWKLKISVCFHCRKQQVKLRRQLPVERVVETPQRQPSVQDRSNLTKNKKVFIINLDVQSQVLI